METHSTSAEPLWAGQRLHAFLGRVRPWQLMLASVVSSVVLSALMSVLLMGSVQPIMALVGLIVSSLVTPAVLWVLYTYRGALEAANATLEARVQERTAALEVACWEADAASRLKGAFLSTVSHELRTPMNGVLGILSLLEEASATDRAELIPLAQSSAAQMQRLVEDVLDLSHLEEGGLTLAEAPFALGTVLGRAVSLKRPLADARGLRLDARLPDSLPEVVGDGLRLQQVILNLLDNAIKFTDAGSVTLTAQHTDGGQVTIAVEDTGIGIPAARQQQIFERFTQVDGSSTRRFGGTGVGLAICRHLIERMGGRIEVASRPGEGTTFTVRLRLPISHA